MNEKKQYSTNKSITVIPIVLILLSLWCLWRSIFYGRMINILKFAAPGLALNLCAIFVIKRLKCFTAIPAYIMISLLIGYPFLTFASQMHKRYYGNLYDAINTGDAEVVKRRIADGYDVNARFLSQPLTRYVFFWDARAFSRDDPHPDKEVIDKKIVEMLERITGHEGKMWGDSIIGFGDKHYKHASGREGDWFLAGFSPRKQNLTLYIMTGFSRYGELMEKLGKYKTGKACLYINKLADVDEAVLEELIRKSIMHAQD